MSDFLTNQELYGLKQDKKKYEKELSSFQHKFAAALRNELGEDIQNVINGKTLVKLSFWEKIKYKTRFFLDKIFNNF